MLRELPADIEAYRDASWHREATLRVETAIEAERFIERVGFSFLMTDNRKPGPSLYVAVCGRRDAQMPRNVQKDPESSLTWTLKDEITRRGRVYYGKVLRSKATFIAPRLVGSFFAIWGIPRTEEKRRLSAQARAILKVLRKEWEMATQDLRKESRIDDRATFTRAIDELQSAMIVVPAEVVYVPKFTYIWTLSEGRFPKELSTRIERSEAVKEIARCFLSGAGMTLPGELSRIIGVSRPEVGLGHRALVADRFAVSPESGVYHLSDLDVRLRTIMQESL
jgi:hypothetical protein